MIEIDNKFNSAEMLVEGQYYLALFKGNSLNTRKPDTQAKVYLCNRPASGKILLNSVDLILHKIVPNNEYEEAQFFKIVGRVGSHDAKRLLSGVQGFGTSGALEQLLEDVQDVLAPLVETGNAKLKTLFERVKILNS
ncbi:hypothetical protein D3C87_278400 [compost metagenome]